MMQRVVLMILALTVTMVSGVPATLADSLGTSSSPIVFNAPAAGDILAGGTAVGDSYSISGTVNDGDVGGGIWSIGTDFLTPSTLTFSGSAVSMNGGSANFTLNDSLGGLLTGSLVWTEVIADPTNATETDLIGTIASLDVAPFAPTPNGFTSYFSDLTNGAAATITVVINCGGVDCTSVDPTGSIVGVDVTPGTPTSPPPMTAPEPEMLALLGLGLPALCFFRRRLAR